MVITPKFEYVEPVLDDGSGPFYEAQDLTYVEASSKREAIKKGVKEMRSSEYLKKWGPRFSYYGGHWDKSTNPYTGVKAESAECEHGVCFCDIEGCSKWNDTCKECDKIYQMECSHLEGFVNDSSQSEQVCWQCGATESDVKEWDQLV